MSSAEVVAAAFPGSLDDGGGFVPESTIVAAQEKFIKPTLNGLYAALEQGTYPDLLDEYVKPALAAYVRYMMLPAVAANVGTVGIVQPRSTVFTPASDRAVAAVRRRTRADATTLMRRCVEHIETLGSNVYPEYDPLQNVLNRVSVDAGVVL